MWPKTSYSYFEWKYQPKPNPKKQKQQNKLWINKTEYPLLETKASSSWWSHARISRPVSVSFLSIMIFEAVAKIDGNHKIARPVGVAKVSNRCLLARRLLMPLPKEFVSACFAVNDSNHEANKWELNIRWTMDCFERIMFCIHDSRYSSARNGLVRILSSVFKNSVKFKVHKCSQQMKLK